ncbi:MAG: helix-turn-helix transcriptional regulator [Treponema sp.]|jgi:transcriptional regulator with XRE-family HTH domain|nr:helix-turn-helix transcriptional regulator [Treponema sp.]
MKEKIDEKYIFNLISSNIKRLRALQNFSQLDLSINTGLTHNFINDIENRKKGISARSLASLSNALNVEPYQFFLPEGISGGDMMIYVKDFNDSLQKVVSNLTEQYLTKDKKSK